MKHKRGVARASRRFLLVDIESRMRQSTSLDKGLTTLPALTTQSTPTHGTAMEAFWSYASKRKTKAFMWHIPGQPAIPQRVGSANLLQVDYRARFAWNEFQLREDPDG